METYSHGDTVQASYSEELRQVVAEARRKLEDDEQAQIAYHDILATIPVICDQYMPFPMSVADLPVADAARYQSADRSKHQRHRDSLVEECVSGRSTLRGGVLTQVTADGSLLKSAAISVAVKLTVKKSNASHAQASAGQPSATLYDRQLRTTEANSEHVPLVSVKLAQYSVWVLELRSWRFQRRHSRRDVMKYLLGRVEPARCHMVAHLETLMLLAALKAGTVGRYTKRER